MSPEEQREVEIALLKKEVKWVKLKMTDMHKAQHGIRDDIGDLTFQISRLFKDDKTGDIGYIAMTKDLMRKHFATNKRIDGLETVKKFIWASMVLGSGAIGWLLKFIYDKI